MSRLAVRKRLLAPEVIQTSAMDCGPAALKCLLEGFGVPVSYGRLREACQTDLDGTSIDTLEEIAWQLGLGAEQVMLPVDHLLLPESGALPALLVVRLPTGFTHFVVVWRRHGPLVQLMDPGSGRRWLTCAQLLREVYVHELRVPAADWHAWARSEDFFAPLARRLGDLRVGRAAQGLLDEAAASPEWRALARLDAAVRLVTSLVWAKGIRRGREAQQLLLAFLERAQNFPASVTGTLPEAYWSVRPAPPVPSDPSAPAEEEIILKGAVLVRVRGLLMTDELAAVQTTVETSGTEQAPVDLPPESKPSVLSPELAAALAESPSRPGRELLRLLRGDGVLSFTVLGGALAVAAGSLILEALILGSLIGLGHSLSLVTQRLTAVGYFLLFTVALLFVELRVTGALLRLGRRLEARLRFALLEKLPRLVDHYFRSRPVSDMAERSHSLQQLRLLPRLGGQLLRAALSLLITGAALAWLHPAGMPITALAVLLALGLPLAFKPHLEELDLRLRTHTGALSRFYLDALLGLTTVRAHAAERAVRREHENLLVEWSDAGLRLIRSAVALEGLQTLSGFGLAVLLLFLYARGSDEPAGALLLAYWALSLPLLGEEVALLVRQYPIHRNLTLRLLEPLGAPEERAAAGTEPPATEEPRWQNAGPEASLASRLDKAGGVAIALEGVTVRTAGHTILQDLILTIDSGRHVGIAGTSGAGKSSLVGLLLGFHRAATGRVLVDGYPLNARRLDALREETVWIDPTIQLWNRSLLANLTYGADPIHRLPLSGILEATELYDLLERLPQGLQSSLGEGGGLISGGEGQRVRVGRGMLRPQVRLVILDEPFRGLERAKRQALLDRLRQIWSKATLLCITHDVSETLSFERVLVVEGGRIVEDGTPPVLAAHSASRYRALLEAEAAVRAELWESAIWQRLQLRQGRLSATGGPP